MRTLITATVALGLVASAAGPAAAETFTTIDVPNGSNTQVVAINAGGSVTGYYGTSSGTLEGFLRTADGTITTFVASPTAWTTPTGINRQGEITGYDTDHNEEGFERTTTGAIRHIRIKGKGHLGGGMALSAPRTERSPASMSRAPCTPMPWGSTGGV